MVYRTHDTELLNRIANSSAVLPFIGGVKRDDWLTPEDDENVVLLTDGENAIGAFINTAPNIYQCHWLFGENVRGRAALDLCQQMVNWMRGYGAEILWGTTPLDNRKALWFNRRMGAVPTWHDEAEQVFEYRMAS